MTFKTINNIVNQKNAVYRDVNSIGFFFFFYSQLKTSGKFLSENLLKIVFVVPAVGE